MMMMMMKLN